MRLVPHNPDFPVLDSRKTISDDQSSDVNTEKEEEFQPICFFKWTKFVEAESFECSCAEFKFVGKAI